VPHKKKKLDKTKPPKKQLSETKNKSKKTSTKLNVTAKDDENNAPLKERPKEIVKSVIIKKPRTGPKKTGWWSQ
jgi:hypothetical protein